MADFTPPGSANQGQTTYGVLTNVQILAIASPSDGESAFSSDDFIPYTFLTPNWYSTGGGVLV